MKKIISILLVSSLLTTCNANENKQSRLSELKEKTINFLTNNKKTVGAVAIAAVTIPGGGYFFYRIKKRAAIKRAKKTEAIEKTRINLRENIKKGFEKQAESHAKLYGPLNQQSTEEIVTRKIPKTL